MAARPRARYNSESCLDPPDADPFAVAPGRDGPGVADMARAKSRTKAAAEPSPFEGRWDLVRMSAWGESPPGPGERSFLEFEPDGLGWFEIGDIQGEVDARLGLRDGKPAVEFSWEGADDLLPCSGRGWAVLEGDRLVGLITLHMGDDSEFEAVRGLRVVRGGRKQAKPGKSVAARAPAAGSLYQLKVTLQGIRPPIWRRLVVPDGSLARLHEVIQAAMGWENYHLYAFEIGGTDYADPESAGELGMRDARRARLGDVVPGAKFKFIYNYDFGDDWRHEVLVEKVLPPGSVAEVPTCLDGKRACPPEDVGGPWGYPAFLEALADPKHARHEEVVEWIGAFDPEAFDRDAVNEALRELT